MSEQVIELERVYTVPLDRAWITARHRRTRRAVNILREFAEHHMKSTEIKITTELNEELWKRGITKPPRRITVKMEKDEDGVVTISLPKKAKKEIAPAKEETAPIESPSEGNKSIPTVTTQETTTPPTSEDKSKSPKSTKKAAAKKKAKKTEN